MRTTLLRLLVLVLLVTGAAVTAGAGSAAPPPYRPGPVVDTTGPSADPGAARRNANVCPRGSSFGAYRRTLTQKVIGGAFTYWSFSSEVQWCFDGTAVTRILSVRAWPEELGPLWEYAGLQSTSTSGGVGVSYYQYKPVGHFRYACTPYVGCVRHAYPAPGITVKGNGTANPS